VIVSQTWETILSAAGGIIGALLTFAGARFGQRQASKQQKITTELERDKVDAQAYAEGRQVWDSLIKDLQVERDSQKSKISDLQVKVDAQHMEADQWHKRLEDMEQKRAGDRQSIHLLAGYARRLLRLVEDNGLVPPQPPEGLDLTG
jgi:uncharacterized membrane-anchored protein YhcB (DUF1043 family)